MNTLQLRDEQNAACGVASPEEVDQMPPNFTPPQEYSMLQALNVLSSVPGSCLRGALQDRKVFSQDALQNYLEKLLLGREKFRRHSTQNLCYIHNTSHISSSEQK